MKIDQLQTPCYVIDEKKMRENLEILKKVQEDTGCKILLAQKAFSGFALYPMIGKYLAGTTASGCAVLYLYSHSHSIDSMSANPVISNTSCMISLT